MYPQYDSEKSEDQDFSCVSTQDKNNVTFLHARLNPETRAVETEIFSSDPSLKRVYDSAAELLREQQVFVESEGHLKIAGVTISELQDKTGLGYSVIHRRLKILVKEKFLVDKKGGGRTPDLFFLPDQYEPEEEVDDDINPSDFEILEIINSKRKELRKQLQELDSKFETVKSAMLIKEDLISQIKKEQQ